jgi:hypothetical protein
MVVRGVGWERRQVEGEVGDEWVGVGREVVWVRRGQGEWRGGGVMHCNAIAGAHREGVGEDEEIESEYWVWGSQCWREREEV